MFNIVSFSCEGYIVSELLVYVVCLSVIMVIVGCISRNPMEFNIVSYVCLDLVIESMLWEHFKCVW